MPLKRQLEILVPWARYVVLATVLGALAAFALSSTATPRYLSEVTILVSPPLNGSLSGDDIQVAQSLRQTFADLVLTRSVLTRARDAAGSDISLDQLSGGIATRVPEGSGLLSIAVTTPNADESASIANAIVEQLRTYVSETQGGEGQDLELTVVDPALPATGATGLGSTRSALLGAAIGFVAVVALAFLVDNLRSREDDV